MFSIHHSALIAAASYAAGLAIGYALPADVMPSEAGATLALYAQAVALVAFLLIVAAIQRHMGVPLDANVTATPPTLCTTGVFRYSRNPIYLAFLLPLAALGLHSLWAALISIVLYVTTTTWFVIRKEEKALSAMFGAAFEDYKRTTPRWILI